MYYDQIKHAYAAGIQRSGRDPNMCFMNEKTFDELVEDYKNATTGQASTRLYTLMGCNVVKAELKYGEFLFMYMDLAEISCIIPVPVLENKNVHKVS